MCVCILLYSESDKCNIYLITAAVFNKACVCCKSCACGLASSVTLQDGHRLIRHLLWGVAFVTLQDGRCVASVRRGVVQFPPS